MTQDEIIEMAIQGHAGTRDAIRWAINQVVKAEREACAKLCDELVNEENTADYQNAANWCSVRIRARGEALAQPEQEPWCMKMNGCKTKCEDCPVEVAQHIWVGLSDEEIAQAIETINMLHGDYATEVAYAIEAKLKDKNS